MSEENDPVRLSLRIAGAAAVFMLLSSCGPPTLAEIEGRSFFSMSDFVESISCSEYFRVFPEWAGEAPVVDTEDEAVEMATSVLAPSQPDVAEAVKAGEVWLLIDRDGFVFAAMESVGASIGGCSGY